jgi:hypothetical protein
MANYTRQLLSGSTNGKPIKIGATAIGSATTLHTALTGVTGFDEVYVWFVNTDVSADHVVTVTFGGLTDPDHITSRTVVLPKSGVPQLLLAGPVLQNGLAVSAFCDVTNIVNAFGYVNRIN